NLSVSAGAFQPVARNASVTGDRELGFQGLATYSLGDMGKLWGAFISQGNEQTNTNAPVADISGFEVGGTLNFGSLGLTANYFTGDGLGTALIGFGGSDALAQERESQGYLVQATYKVGDTKFGVNYGVSSLDATANDRATATCILDESEQLTLGVYHNLTPSLTIAGEYITNTVK
ncbi:porin, partial [Klebsiella pneumoniae]